MPKQSHPYFPEGASLPPPLRWTPAVHQTTGDQVLLLPFDPPGAPARIRQLQQLMQAIPALGSSLLLGPSDAQCQGPAPYFCVPQAGLQPLNCQDVSRLLTPAQIDILLLNLARALHQLHQGGMVMGMLSPENLLTRTPLSENSVLLSGFVHLLDPRDLPGKSTKAYAPPHAAPELVEYARHPTPYRASRISPACDVFSLGVVFHVLLTGALPGFSLTSGSNATFHKEALLSRKLDYPHRQLLRNMMRLNAAERLQDMAAVEKEIARLIRSSDCTIHVRRPDLAGQTVTVRADSTTCNWKRLDNAGSADFCPLLADEDYDLICSGTVFSTVHFPDATGGQAATVDASGVTMTPAKGKARSRTVPPPIPAGASPESRPAPPPQPARSTAKGKAPAATALNAKGSAPTSGQNVAKDKVSAKEPTKQPVQNNTKTNSNAKTPAAKPTQPAQTAAKAKSTPAQPTTKAKSAPSQPAQPAAKAKSTSRQPTTKAKPAPRQPVLKQIPVVPPLNNIRLIEVLSPELCRLTLINCGTFTIRTADAHRYGVAHLLTSAPVAKESVHRPPVSHDPNIIAVDPPLNNVRLVEILSPERCRLTLVNCGSFTIRSADAHRYGISHLITKGGE